MDPFQKEDNKQFLDNMYRHTRYTNNVQKHQNLLIFSGNNINNNNEFSFELQEPLKIDTISDIYLDNFTTYDIGSENANTQAHKQFFVVKINQFNLNGSSNIESFKNAIIIPNDDNGGQATVKVHKGKKMNYITTLMPQTIDRISGTITDWSASSIIQNSKIIINTAPSTDQTLIFTSHGTEGIIYTITLTGNQNIAAGNFTVSSSTNSVAVGTFSTKSSINQVADTINQAIDQIITNLTAGDVQGNNVTGFTTTLDGNTVSIETTRAHSVTLSGTYLTDSSSNVTVGHPHFLMEFLIINRD